MKKYMYGLFILVVLSTACKKEPAGTADPSTDTAETTGSSGAATTSSTEADARHVEVDFAGLVCHLWNKSEGGVERAIVLRTPGGGAMEHKMRIGLPPESRADVLRLRLPIDPVAQCPVNSTCNVVVNGLAFRFADGAGNPLSAAFSPNANFKNFVTHLRAVPHPAHPFATRADLIDAMFDPTPKSTDPDVAGWFELAGGNGDAERYTCVGHFEGHAQQDFVKLAMVTFTLPMDGKLQVFIAGDTQWRDLAIPASDFAMTVDNDSMISTASSHFDAYARLHKKKISTEPDIDLPDVIVPTPGDCTGDIPATTTSPVDTVPGCSNSSWP